MSHKSSSETPFVIFASRTLAGSIVTTITASHLFLRIQIAHRQAVVSIRQHK